MIVIFHKDSHERHRLECIRTDGSTTSANLDTRSLLRHEEKNLPAGEEIGTTEMVVAILQGALRDGMDPAVAHAAITQALDSRGLPTPPWLTTAFIASLLPEYRFFMKRWAALRTGDSIRLEFR